MSDVVSEQISDQQPTVVKDEPVSEKSDADTKPEDVKSEDAGATVTTENKSEEDAPTEQETATTSEPVAETETAADPEPEVEEIIEIPSGSGEWVLVTGATGYLGSNIVKQLVESGEFRVRGTTRTLANNDRLSSLKELLADSKLDLEFVSADFNDPGSWKPAVEGCQYVVHCASVYPDVDNSVNVEELYKDGTVAVLKACQESGTVKRVVMTSSLTAVSSGHNVVKNSMTEETWADIEKTVGAVERSKIIAERAAWDFMKEFPEGSTMELSVVNPGFCVGPPLMKSEGKSAELIKKLLTREYEQLPKLNYSIIDVRDAALSHIRAMMIKQSAGQRHLVCQSPIWLKDMANILSQEFSSKGWNVSTTQVPYIKLWIKSHLKSGQEMKKILPYVGKVYNYDTKKMKKILQVEPREVKESIVEMAQAMIDLGMVEKVEKPEKEKKSLKFSFKRQKKAAAVEVEGEEKKDDEKKDEETAAEAPADAEATTEPTVAIESEPAIETTVEKAADTEVKAEIEKAGSEAEGSVPSDEEKKEEGATDDPESSKKKEKKEKKEKKKGLFSFSFKKNKKPAVEKKAEEEQTPAAEVENTETAEQKEEAPAASEATEGAAESPEAAAESTTDAAAETTEAAVEDKPAEEQKTEVTQCEPTPEPAEPVIETPEIVVNEPTESAKPEEPKSEESKPTENEETTTTTTTQE